MKKLERELKQAELASNSQIRSLIHKLQTSRRLPSELIIDQYNDDGKRYIANLIVDMELIQMAESIVKIDQRYQPKSGSKQSQLVLQSMNNVPCSVP